MIFHHPMRHPVLRIIWLALALALPAGAGTSGAEPPDRRSPGEAPWVAEESAFPTPEGVESYRTMLEARLLERYNNLPDHAGKVARVDVVLSRPLDVSLDGKYIRAEFDQLVYDSWGRRVSELEKEYYVITFGDEGVAEVRSDPSIRVGLDMEKVYSERAPLAGDPFRGVESPEAFRDTPRAKMPEWWRPEYDQNPRR